MNLIIDRGMHPIFDRALGFSSFDESTRQQGRVATNQASRGTLPQPMTSKNRRVDLDPHDPNLQEHRRF